MRETIKAAGGATIGGFEYSTTTTDFTQVVSKMRTELDVAVKIYGKEKVAVYVPGFDEVADLAAAIPADDTLLRGLRWYGGDGTVNSTSLASQAAFFEQVGYGCPDVGIGDATKRAYGAYDMKALRTINGTPTWVVVGTWDAVKGYKATP